jgi:hypothetical protein
MKTLNRSCNVNNGRIISVTRIHMSNGHQTTPVTNILCPLPIKHSRCSTILLVTGIINAYYLSGCVVCYNCGFTDPKFYSNPVNFPRVCPPPAPGPSRTLRPYPLPLTSPTCPPTVPRSLLVPFAGALTSAVVTPQVFN